MFCFRGILLVITLISNTQTVEKPMEYNLKTKQKFNDYKENDKINRNQESTKGPQKKEWSFEDYMKKFEPGTIWERIDKQKKYNGLVISDQEQSEMMFQAMDPIDEIMDLKIENGDAKLILEQGRRQGWQPPQGGNPDAKDKFYLKQRMYELMKQAIYQTRNKMVVMQILREKYSNSSLYKMGFLMNKADNAAKTFGKFSFRAYRSCLLSREQVVLKMPVFDLLLTNERQLNLWFNVELLVDLIVINNDICKEIFKNQTEKRTQKFDEKFVI